MVVPSLKILSILCSLSLSLSPQCNTHGWLAVGILSWLCAKWEQQYYHLKNALLTDLMVRTQWLLKHFMDHWNWNYAIWICAFVLTKCMWICVCLLVCKTGDRDILYSVGVDSYGPLNGSNNVKELQCHIHQSWLSVKARQRCWHFNTTRWVRRPFKCQLPDT